MYKSFGGVQVLEDVGFQLRPGEVVGLLGDNGAGKSTLIKIVTGVHQPDQGEIVFGGRQVTGLTVQKARELGSRPCSRNARSPTSCRSGATSSWAGPSRGHLGLLKVAEMRRITSELMRESMGFTSAVLTPDTPVMGLSGGERQGLAIVRALYFEADIIILDEPTMGLSLKETDKLLHFVRGIRAAGKSAIFIDHNIFHVYSVCDRIIVIDRGRVAGEFPTSRYSLNELMDIMREVAEAGSYTEPARYRADAPCPVATGPGREQLAATVPARPRPRHGLAAFATRWASQIGITVAFLLLWLVFIVLAPGTFLSDRIYLSFAQTTPYFAMVAMPLTMVIIAGDIDLSFPSIMALGHGRLRVGLAGDRQRRAWRPGGAGVAALAGLFNGAGHHARRDPLARRHHRHPVPVPGIDARARRGKSYRPRRHQGLAGRTTSWSASRFGIPMEFWWLVLVTIGAWVLLNRHRLGQNAYVIGDNRQAAALMGIPIRRTRITLFVLTGFAAAFAGLLNSLQVVNFYPNMGGGYLLPTLAAVFVGGTSVFGGRGSIWGTFIGAFMIGGITGGHRRASA